MEPVEVCIAAPDCVKAMWLEWRLGGGPHRQRQLFALRIAVIVRVAKSRSVLEALPSPGKMLQITTCSKSGALSNDAEKYPRGGKS